MLDEVDPSVVAACDLDAIDAAAPARIGGDVAYPGRDGLGREPYRPFPARDMVARQQQADPEGDENEADRHGGGKSEPFRHHASPSR